MMSANSTSQGLLKDYVVAFGTLFNNIRIKREYSSKSDQYSEPGPIIAVPLTYAPKARFAQRINQDLGLNRPTQITLPRMSFEMTSVTYAPERKLNTMNRTVKKLESPYSYTTTTGNGYVTGTWAPVPYDFAFSLNIYIKNIEDGTNIIEQILPYFTPEFTVTLKSATDLGIKLDLPVVLSAVNLEDSFEGGFDDRRIITWTLDFIMKGMIYGATTNSQIIKKAIVNLRPVATTISDAITLRGNNAPIGSHRVIVEAPNAATPVRLPTYTPNGAFITYVEWPDLGAQYLKTIDASGLGGSWTDFPLTGTGLISYGYRNDWNASSPIDYAPNSSMITFQSDYSTSQNDRQVWVMKTDSTGEVELTDLAGGAGQPRFSPNGSMIAYRAEGKVFIMKVDGSDKTQLTISNDGHPAFSIDGTKIAYVSASSGNWEVWMMDVDGSNKTQITDTAAIEAYGLDFSPEGNQIVYGTSGEANDGYSVYVMDIDGSNRYRISAGGESSDPTPQFPRPTHHGIFLPPRWSPNGTEVVYGISDTGGTPAGAPDPTWSYRIVATRVRDDAFAYSTITSRPTMNVASDGTKSATTNTANSVSIYKIGADDPFGISTDLTLNGNTNS